MADKVDDMVADKVADIVADKKEEEKVADMEVDKVADMVADNKNIARGTTDPGIESITQIIPTAEWKRNTIVYILYDFYGKCKRAWSSLYRKSPSPSSDNTFERCFYVCRR